MQNYDAYIWHHGTAPTSTTFGALSTTSLNSCGPGFADVSNVSGLTIGVTHPSDTLRFVCCPMRKASATAARPECMSAADVYALGAHGLPRAWVTPRRAKLTLSLCTCTQCFDSAVHQPSSAAFADGMIRAPRAAPLLRRRAAADAAKGSAKARWPPLNVAAAGTLAAAAHMCACAVCRCAGLGRPLLLALM